MTATLAPPPAAPSPPRQPTDRGVPPPAGDVPLLLVAEVALMSMTVAAVIGLGRLFEDGTFLLPVLTVTAAAHLLARWCRRRRLGPGATALVAVGGLAATVSWLLVPATTAYGLPTAATLAEMGEQLSSALATFREVVAPAPVEPGFVLAAVVGVWVIAFVADTAAFRVGAVVEAAVPGATLFVFGAALGAPRHRELTTAAFLAGVLGYWLAQRALANAASPTWLARDARGGSRSLLRTGGALAAVAVGAALVLGPQLPGANAPGAIPWRASERGGDDTRVTVSPLVDIRARIVDQAQSVVFTVASEERSYWRLTSLESFNGRIWSSTRSYREATGDLPPGSPLSEASSTTVTQEFEIGALASIWLPAAYRPVEVAGASASYDAESASLIVSEAQESTESGQRYSITSVLPKLTDEALAAVPAAVPTDIADTYTALPEDFSVPVQDEARRVTAGATTPYAKALALQDHFRDGSFRYDLTISPGHGEDALERFLFETRTGYCEQFAGAYAAMARAVGLPARVAVGFTPGEVDPDGRFVVRGANGHAWPEVYLEGYGWVAFEPTPGRGIPGAIDYTGVPEQQATLGEPGTATTVPETGPAPLDPSGGSALPSELPDFGFEDVFPEIEPTVAANPWPRRLLVAGLLVTGLPALWVGAVAAAGWLVHRRRRARATTPRRRVALAWDRASEALASLGAGPEPWETPVEVAARVGPPGVAGGRLRELAAVVSAASYSPAAVSEAAADAAEAASTAFASSVASARSGRRRLRAAFDPRPLLPRRAARRRIGLASA